MAGGGEISPRTSIALLLVAGVAIYARGVVILTAHWPYRAGANGSPMSIPDVFRYLATITALSTGLWVVLSCIGWISGKIWSRPSKRGRLWVWWLATMDAVGFVFLWLLPKIV